MAQNSVNCLMAGSGPVLIDPEKIAIQLRQLPRVHYFWLGFSGGLDSSVLLHLLSEIKPELEYKAVHINHGLRPDAEQWSRHCAEICRQYGVALETVSVNARAAKGESPEAAARNVRYRAMERLMGSNDCLLTAHHQDDQAETLLLQLLRGSGPAGLAAMPALAAFSKGWHMRPLLAFARQTLRDYALERKLAWIEDDSNVDDRYDRNFLRRHILPVLQSRWPAVTATLARAAGHQAEAMELIDVVAASDYAQLLDTLSDTLSASALKNLSESRQRNVLRYWCKRMGALPPGSAVLQQVLLAIRAADDRMPQVSWGTWEIRRYRDNLYLLKQDMAVPLEQYVWPLSQKNFAIPELKLELNLPDLQKAGIRIPATSKILYIRFRAGGERITLPDREHSHSLKKLLQERGVPPWLRSRLPLLYDESGCLLGVLGLNPPIAGTGLSGTN